MFRVTMISLTSSSGWGGLSLKLLKLASVGASTGITILQASLASGQSTDSKFVCITDGFYSVTAPDPSIDIEWQLLNVDSSKNAVDLQLLSGENGGSASFSLVSGEFSSLPCAAGKYSSTGTVDPVDCTICHAGTYAGSGSKFCSSCAAGTFSG